MIKLGMEGNKWTIFVTALELFSEKGYDNTSLRDIVDASGIKSNSFFDYFPSREALLDTMHEFYYENAKASAVPPEEARRNAETLPAKEAIIKTVMATFYSEELQPFMDKIYFISIMRSYRDPKAYDLVWKRKISYEGAGYMSALIETLVELEKIEPIDVDAFIELYGGYAFSVVFRQNTGNPIGMENWMKELEMLFSLLKEKTK